MIFCLTAGRKSCIEFFREFTYKKNSTVIQPTSMLKTNRIKNSSGEADTDKSSAINSERRIKVTNGIFS